jgi:hypothetical protein
MEMGSAQAGIKEDLILMQQISINHVYCIQNMGGYNNVEGIYTIANFIDVHIRRSITQ